MENRENNRSNRNDRFRQNGQSQRYNQDERGQRFNSQRDRSQEERNESEEWGDNHQYGSDDHYRMDDRDSDRRVSTYGGEDRSRPWGTPGRTSNDTMGSHSEGRVGQSRYQGYGQQNRGTVGYGQSAGYGSYSGGREGQASFGQTDGRFGTHQGAQRGGMQQTNERGQHYGKGPKGFTFSDEDVKREVSRELYRHGEVDASDITIEVKNGQVTLSGTVDSRQTKNRIEEFVEEEVAGVTEVNNQLRVKKEGILSGILGGGDKDEEKSSVSKK